MSAISNQHAVHGALQAVIEPTRPKFRRSRCVSCVATAARSPCSSLMSNLHDCSCRCCSLGQGRLESMLRRSLSAETFLTNPPCRCSQSSKEYMQMGCSATMLLVAAAAAACQLEQTRAQQALLPTSPINGSLFIRLCSAGFGRADQSMATVPQRSGVEVVKAIAGGLVTSEAFRWIEADRRN